MNVEDPECMKNDEHTAVDNIQVLDPSLSAAEEIQRLNTRNRWLTRVLSEMDIKVFNSAWI